MRSVNRPVRKPAALANGRGQTCVRKAVNRPAGLLSASAQLDCSSASAALDAPELKDFARLATLVGMAGEQLDNFQPRVMFVPDADAFDTFAERLFPVSGRPDRQTATDALLDAAIANEDAAKQVCFEWRVIFVSPQD